MNIYLRYKPLKNGKYSIYLDYAVDGVRRYEFLRIRVGKDYSDNKKVTEADKQAMELAESIRAKRQYELYSSVDLNTASKQVNKYLFDYIEIYYEQTNRSNYLYLLNHLKSFSKKPPLLSEVNVAWINRFMKYLASKVDNNSVHAYMSAFRMFINKAYREKLISENPFDRIQLPKYVQSKRTYLTLDELRLLAQNKCLSNEQIEQAFLFACFTGLRFSDVENLRPDDIQAEKDKDGNISYVLLIRPVKTANTSGKLLKIPLAEQALKIITEIKRCKVRKDGYKARADTRAKSKENRLFDNLYNNAACNKLLKKWAKHAGLDKNLHYHIGRHRISPFQLKTSKL